MKFVQEFKEFAVKGNALDMAVGIIIGAAFNKIVNSLVNDIIMPPIGLMLGGVEFKHLQIILRKAYISQTGEEIPIVAVRYGSFINTVIEFLIIALSVFVVIKVMNRIINFRELNSKKTS